MSELQQTLSGLMTGLLLILFIGICIWSWSGKRKESFDRMASLPLEEDSPSTGNHTKPTQFNLKTDKSEASL